MKSIKDFINESINESSEESVMITTLYDMLDDPKHNNPQELLEFGWSEELIDYFIKHCCIVPAQAGFRAGDEKIDWVGYNGLEDVIEKLSMMSAVKASDARVKKVLRIPDVKDQLKFEPKLLGFRWVSGYDCPAIICVDEDTPMAKKICELAEEFI